LTTRTSRYDMAIAELDETWRQLSAWLAGNSVWASGDVPDWEAVVALSDRLGLSPLLYRVLKQADRKLPAAAEARLTNAYCGTLAACRRDSSRRTRFVLNCAHAQIVSTH